MEAGEPCDDGNANNNDTCIITNPGGPVGPANCAVAACGDGYLCSGAGCTTGPGGGPEEWDNGAPSVPFGCEQRRACNAFACQLLPEPGTNECNLFAPPSPCAPCGCPPPSGDFLVDKPRIVVPPQATATLIWNLFNVSGCDIDQGIGTVVPPLSGTHEIAPTSTRTYTLTCMGNDGSLFILSQLIQVYQFLGGMFREILPI